MLSVDEGVPICRTQSSIALERMLFATVQALSTEIQPSFLSKGEDSPPVQKAIPTDRT